jgi:D-amino-acid dehydrogenase
MSSPASSNPPSRTEILVIGAGVVGASIARELAARGARVTILDRAPGIGGGCSYANAALLAPDHVGPLATPALLREVPGQMLRRPPAVRVRPSRDLTPWLGKLVASATPHRAKLTQAGLRQLALESTRLHCALAELGLNPTLEKKGAVDVYLRSVRPGMSGMLTSQALRVLEPGLAPAVSGGFHHTEEWVVESRSYVGTMLEDAQDHGAEVLHHTNARQFIQASRRLSGVETNRGTIHFDHAVLASGVEAGYLARQVGLSIPLRGGRGYVIDVEAPQGTLAMPVRLKEHRVVVTPLEDRVRVCGSMEFGDENRPADLRRADMLLAVAARAVPGLKGQRVIDRWAGERPCSPDGVPLIGKTAATANLSIAAGHGMWGLILAPITARVISNELIDGNSNGQYPWLNPDRFTPDMALCL